MKRPSLIKSITGALFACAVLFTVTVHQVHYLFTEHNAHEQCDNHLHGDDQHNDCHVCKFDAGVFVESFTQFENTAVVFIKAKPAVIISTTFKGNQPSTLFLRGPPSIA